jgi:hypothetical protein
LLPFVGFVGSKVAEWFSSLTTDTNYLSLDDLDKLWASAQGISLPPLEIEGRNYYCMIVHPSDFERLKQDPGWKSVEQVRNEYGFEIQTHEGFARLN